VKSVVLSAPWAGQRRLARLRQLTAGAEELAHLRAELPALRDENHRLEFENGLLRSRLRHARSRKPHYTPMQRLQILWHITYYAVPRSRVKKHFGIATSTLYRWLHAMERGDMGDNQSKREGSRKTPAEIAQLIWRIFEANPHFGRHRIAMILRSLRVFVATSTVRNVLLCPAPRTAPAAASAKVAHAKPRKIVARYPNHVWSVDRTWVWRWHVWPTWVLVGIDHYSRMVTTTCLLEGPNYEWLNHAPVLRGFDHLVVLLADFERYYNHYRGHSTLGGAPPAVIHQGQQWLKPPHSAKVLPLAIERRVFADTRVTAYRLTA
jgi:transposase